MAELSNLGYVVFGVSDLAAWEDFAVNIAGLQIGHKTDDAMALRMDEYEHRIALETNAADDILAAGWELDTEDELDEYVDALRKSGVGIADGGEELAARRCVERIYVCDDPMGFKHEFFYGPRVASLSNPFRSHMLRGAGFETGRLGMGHILPGTNDYAASVNFYKSILGLKITDYIREEVAPGFVVDATFFHSATGRHHSLATAMIPGPKRLNHFMIQVKDFDDVGLAYDRVLKAGLPVVLSLGHHPNDKMFSFYVQTPSGFAMEFGHGGIVVDDENWKIVSYSQLSDWGHKRA
ncbi:glyoxalase [Parvibaculum sedimenti]|uniref:Glyoxalase n=1 Tax=Parvibaculum sedimenti TaxID=2608632 RepID=A0A6N6VE97_9HYPH|nr:VOC family protein [Parvibaculum sedimenti]KAB7738873.1 glyoxalase [Parvibaculum sedimenti]